MSEDKEIEPREWISSSIADIQKCVDEMKWQRLLTQFPNEFGGVEGGDSRSQVLLFLSWLLTDLFDNHWGDFTPLEMVKLLRDIADAITDCTEPG